MNFKKLIDIICLIIPLMSTIFCLLSEYPLQSLLPLTFLIFYIILLRNIDKNEISFTFYAVLIFSLFRLVITPMVISITNDIYIDNTRLGKTNITLGIYHILYEFIWISIAFYVFSKLKIKNNEINMNYRLYGSRFFYVIFLILSSIVLFIFPDIRNSISLFIIKSASLDRINEDLNFGLLLGRQFILIALNIFFILVCYEFYKIYKIKPKFKYVIIPLIFGMINISVIVGERRSLQIYTLIITIFLLAKLFKHHRKLLIYSLLVVGGTVLIGMTVYKEFYAFAYGGYTKAIEANLSKGEIPWADRLQAYFYGIHNVAANIDLAKYQTIEKTQFIYDNLRSIVGSSLLMNGTKPLTTQLFNQTLFGANVQTGQLFSSVGYGSIFFGFFLSPIFTIINLSACLIMEKLLRNTQTLEFIYLLSFIVLRISFNIFSAPPPIINQITLLAFPFLIIIITSGFIKKILKVR